MCGFAVSNTNLDISLSNENCKKRGPDKTTTKIIRNIQFLHNLLHITGEYVEQPFSKDNVICVFNGEIYNYKNFGNYSSDGECIIDLYKEYGINFAKELDGEFAICIIDFASKNIIISNDVFACKPLWYEFTDDKFCIASYKSQLDGLGFKNAIKLKANKTISFSLINLKKKQEVKNFYFNLKQYKNTFDDWIEEFSKSIYKRTQNTNCKFFIGLSSGYDSGAIACELEKQKILFKSFTILNNENEKILKERLKTIKNKSVFYLSKEDFERHKSILLSNCENFQYLDYNLIKNQANVGVSFICNLAKLEGIKINLSGQGADEIISDYGFNEKKIYKQSCFGGLFPKKLENIFPWCNFWDGTQIQYLNAQEYVAGSYGIETRYPFLDKYLVQEFLSLSAELKNINYKSCIDKYLSINNFPYEQNKKRGFYVL